ncbi:ricin-type beta-trefoil lectin domain protein [Streptomyces zaomyceticus]|uniref:ricin-type beta-trefoil lectin domain protein n=1 Tax=Streptomyces zaomyceticus TaxID=68286 RepID=UPI0036911956
MVFKLTSSSIQGTRAGHTGLAAAATVTLLAGLSVAPSGAATAAPAATPSADVAAASWPGGTFIIQNYRTKGCISQVLEKMNIFALRSPRDCTNNVGQLWLHGSGNSIRHWLTEKVDRSPLHHCLDASNAGAVSIRPCTGTNHQKWDHYEAGFLKNRGNGQCLDVLDEHHPNYPDMVYTRQCLHHEWQKWAFKPF